MNDFELESKLKSIPLPRRTEEYWEDFPAQVRANLRRPPENSATQNFRLPRLAWCGGFALVCLTFALALWPVFQITLKNERAFRRELAQLPNHLRTFMADEHGMHYLIADQQ